LNAAKDLKIQLKEIPKISLQVADALETIPVIPTHTLSELINASSEIDVIIQEFDKLHIPHDSKERIAVMESKDAIKASIHAIEGLYDSHGNVLTLTGNEGLISPTTHAGFKKFMQDCKDNGRKCIPESEIKIIGALLNAAEVKFLDYDFIDEVAEYDSLSIGDEEKALFGSSESITLSEVLRTYATTLSSNGMWLNVDLERSPLTIKARTTMSEFLVLLDQFIPGIFLNSNECKIK